MIATNENPSMAPKTKYSPSMVRASKAAFYVPLKILVSPKYYYEQGAPKRSFKGRGVIVCNHDSYSDGFLMYLAWWYRHIFPVVSDLALDKKSLFAKILRRMGAIRVDSKKSDLSVFRTVKAYLELERAVLVMPEGHVNWLASRIREFKYGAFKMAIESDAPIYPTYVGRIKPHTRTHIFFGKPITSKEAYDAAAISGNKPIVEMHRLATESMKRLERDYELVQTKKYAKRKHVWRKPKVIKMGDRIRVRQQDGTYHYGIYLSATEVIHYASENGNSLGDPADIKVRTDTLVTFARSANATQGDDCLKLSEVQVKKITLRERFSVRGKEKIAKRARKSLGEVDYDPIYNNTEHFVNRCAIGLRVSLDTYTAQLTIDNG